MKDQRDLFVLSFVLISMPENLLKTPSLQLPNSFMSPPTSLSIRFNHILES